jgi:glyoxylate carboligase
MDQMALCQPHTKYARQPIDHADIPNVLMQAFNSALQGRPGASYVDLVIINITSIMMMIIILIQVINLAC